MALTPSVTGLLPWWTYQSHLVPGVGEAIVNVVNLNFLMAENDLHVPGGGVPLDFQRMYNSESGHNASNTDGSTPSVFGNRWTNNLDVHLGWSSLGQNTRTISVYTADGARVDYTCTINAVATCTAATAGIYDILATTQLGGNGIACQLQWTKKSGTSYVFDAPYPDCTTNQAGYYGRLLAISARNSNFSIQLTYSWSPDASNPENIATIVATHKPDLATLTLAFGQIAGSNPTITELSSVSRPDGQTINYHYTATGELADVDKPGNNPVLNGHPLPTTFLDGAPIAAGNLPETYDIKQPGLMEVCGPRAAISIIDTNGSPTDGACFDFDYSNHQLSDWYTRGVLNPTPQDDVFVSAIQSGPNTGFVQWNDTAFFSNQSQGYCTPSAVMQDQFLHTTYWCYDNSNRVIQTELLNVGNTLTTSQTWNSNNELTTVTDARGNTTNLAYDLNGNVIEVSLPQQTTYPNGLLRPTSLYDYDAYNNLTYYCDPANNTHDSWNPSTSDTLCETENNVYTKYSYDADGNEPYGCLTASYTPSTYSHSLSYTGGSGNCGVGLPTLVKGTGFRQADGNQRNPTQTFVYNNNGTLHTYNPGDPNQSLWTFSYTTEGMNRLHKTTDPEGVASYQCFNLDGSTFYHETARQNDLDASPPCPTNSQLIAGATPPPYALVNGYDADGDVATVLNHHNCVPSTCAQKGNANYKAATNCNLVAVPAGMTCNFYDGLDRLVEVKQPYDSSFDLYTNPWITRYLYDLTGNLQTFQGNSFYAYGNLFQTQELLPQTPAVQSHRPSQPRIGT